MKNVVVLVFLILSVVLGFALPVQAQTTYSYAYATCEGKLAVYNFAPANFVFQLWLGTPEWRTINVPPGGTFTASMQPQDVAWITISGVAQPPLPYSLAPCPIFTPPTPFALSLLPTPTPTPRPAFVPRTCAPGSWSGVLWLEPSDNPYPLGSTIEVFAVEGPAAQQQREQSRLFGVSDRVRPGKFDVLMECKFNEPTGIYTDLQGTQYQVSQWYVATVNGNIAVVFATLAGPTHGVLLHWYDQARFVPSPFTQAVVIPR